VAARNWRWHTAATALRRAAAGRAYPFTLVHRPSAIYVSSLVLCDAMSALSSYVTLCQLSRLSARFLRQAEAQKVMTLHPRGVVKNLNVDVARGQTGGGPISVHGTRGSLAPARRTIRAGWLATIDVVPVGLH
jgi:hypothetical protein